MIKFQLSENEEVAAHNFIKEHRRPDVPKGAIGGHIDYIFTPTGVGDACTIKCSICGKEENITDYSKW